MSPPYFDHLIECLTEGHVECFIHSSIHKF
jgi:hypothetical protein